VSSKPFLERLDRWTLWVGPLVAVALLYRNSLHEGFLGDADFLILQNRFLDHWHQVWNNLTHDYFWSSSGAWIPYWRPVTKLSWLIEARIGGRRPEIFHGVQVGWQLAATLGVQRIAVQLGAPLRTAAIAGLLFGLHPALVEPTCLIMARSDVVSAACGLWAVSGWLWWRARAFRSAAALALHGVATGLALGSKESAVMLAPLLTLWALLPGDAHLGTRRRLWSVAPVWALVGLYLLLRGLVLGRHAAPAATLSGLRLLVGGATYLKALLPLRISTGIRSLPYAEAAQGSTLALAICSWLMVALLMVWAVRSKRTDLAALVAWALASLAPVLLIENLGVPGVTGKIALADRWLAPAVVPTAIFLAALARTVTTRGVQRFLAAVFVAWAAAVVVVSPRAQAPYASGLALLQLEEEQYQATPQQFRTREDECRGWGRRLARAAAEGDARRVLDMRELRPTFCEEDNEALYNIFSALVASKHYAEARGLIGPLRERGLLVRTKAAFLYQAGLTLLELGDAKAAEPLLLESERAGVPSCGLYGQLGRVAGALGRAAEAARHLEQCARCIRERRGSDDADVWVSAGYWWMRAQERPELHAVLQQLGRLPLNREQMQQAARLRAWLEGNPRGDK